LLNNIIASFPFCPEPGFEKIRKKEEPDNEKKYENLDENDQPELPPDCHTAESFIIKMKNTDKDIFMHPG
jgi:hypothetical protein